MLPIGVTRVRRRLHLAVRKVAHRWIDGERPLPIGELISPLRYDILVRRQYLEFLQEHRELYDRDFEEYTRLALGHPYFVWFREIAYPRRQEIRIRSEDMRVAFQNRLRKTTSLYESFTTNGFDTRYPILIRSGTQFTPTSTGKALAPRRFPIDGCHRLALLHMHGQTELPPDFYRVERCRNFTSIDNTQILLGTLDLEPAEYWSFLSLGYSGEIIADREQLIEHVRRRTPRVLAELEQIIAIDEAHLRRA